MYLYKHEWKWHYIGSDIIVLDYNMDLAEKRIRHLLDINWLKEEKLNIEQISLDIPRDVLINNWDY